MISQNNDEQTHIEEGTDSIRGHVPGLETGSRLSSATAEHALAPLAPDGSGVEPGELKTVTVTSKRIKKIKKGKKPAIPVNRKTPPAEHLCLDPEEMSFKNGEAGKYFSPFTKCPRWLDHREDIGWKAKLVAKYLLSLMFGKTPWRCHVGSATMQQHLGLSRKVIDAGVKELEVAGIIAVVSGGRNLANDYYWLKTAVPKDIVGAADAGTLPQSVPPETVVEGTSPQSIPMLPQDVGTSPQDVGTSPQDNLYSPLTTPSTTLKGEGTGREEEKASTASAALRSVGGAEGKETGSQPPKTAASQTCQSPGGDVPCTVSTLNTALTANGDELCLSISRVSDENMALYANPSKPRRYLEAALEVLPPAFRDQRLGHYSDDVQAVFDGWYNGKGRQPTVILYSETPGTGKSCLVAAMFIDVMRRLGVYHFEAARSGYSPWVVFVDQQTYLSKSKSRKAVYDEDGDEVRGDCVADEFNRHVQNARVLWLDDVIGPELPAADRQAFQALLKSRCADGKYTLITSNFSRKQLIEALGVSVWSRVKDSYIYRVADNVVFRDEAAAKHHDPAFTALVARNETVRSQRETTYAAQREVEERAQWERAAEAEKAAATAKRRAEGISEVDDLHQEALYEEAARMRALKQEADKIAKAKADAEAEAIKLTPEYKAGCAYVRESLNKALGPRLDNWVTGPVRDWGTLAPAASQAQLITTTVGLGSTDLRPAGAWKSIPLADTTDGASWWDDHDDDDDDDDDAADVEEDFDDEDDEAADMEEDLDDDDDDDEAADMEEDLDDNVNGTACVTRGVNCWE
ncbi:MAG: hypothetical protein WCK05_06205 [Planctomycetota bacterium]